MTLQFYLKTKWTRVIITSFLLNQQFNKFSIFSFLNLFSISIWSYLFDSLLKARVKLKLNNLLMILFFKNHMNILSFIIIIIQTFC